MHKAQKTEGATLPELKEEDGTAAPHWKRNLAVCVFGSFTTIVSLTLVVPFLPLYVEQLGVQGQASIAEWSGACFAAASRPGWVAPLWGKLADRNGRKLMLIRASLGMAVGMSRWAWLEMSGSSSHCDCSLAFSAATRRACESRDRMIQKWQ
jgi:MFS family permease